MSGSLVAVVYMNRGWWVAMCPRQYCDHAEFFGLAANGAGVGGLTAEYMLCPACGGGWPAAWPSESMRRGVEQLLAERPNPANRNWLPHESLADLVWENLEHGITPSDDALAEVEERGGGTVLRVLDDEVVIGARALPAPGRLAIAGRQ